MGYIVDSDDDWSVELLSESAVITVGESEVNIPDDDFLNVLKSLLEASIEVADRNRQKNYLRAIVENFIVMVVTNE